MQLSGEVTVFPQNAPETLVAELRPDPCTGGAYSAPGPPAGFMVWNGTGNGRGNRKVWKKGERE